MLREKLHKVDLLVSRIVAIYFVFGLLWIFFSDFILSVLATDQAQFAHYSMYKGWAYIAITSVLLYLLVRRTLQQQSKLENSLLASEERWKFALEGADEGVWDWNLETDEVFRSGQWHVIYGYAENEIGRTATDGRKLMHPEDLPRAVEDTRAYLEGKTSIYTSEYRLLCKDGSWKWTLSRGMVVSYSAEGKPLRMIGTHTDITERKRSEAQIFHLAHYDTITALPNRLLFMDRFEQEIKKARRSAHSIALMFLDLDRFKEINDTLGHDMGDLLLKETAQRLLHCIRATDTAARLGGDEFTIILNELHDPSSVEAVAQKILDQLAEPFQLGSEIVYISASIGITIFPGDATNAEVLLKNADQAMYAAKDHGRNCYYYFTPSMQQAAAGRMRIANDLRLALAAGQLLVHYQPIIELATGQVHKAEALVRWQHPVHGWISPTEFIPVAEDTGLIVEVGNFVFKQAINQAALWRANRPNFQISVNKSPVQFRNGKDAHGDWMDYIRARGLSADSIAIEITEGLLLDAQGNVVSQLHDLRTAGIQIAIDDFGTGYSSLAYIKKFEIDYVKIDQSFTRNLAEGSDDLALCEAIIVMSHKLGIKVIAEGVETSRQHELLAAAGCDYAQGYLFSRPVPADEFEKLLQRQS
jgi:diguanylate cyclase (GGDEF)-like protein/PAS domain S-box-containing protein